MLSLSCVSVSTYSSHNLLDEGRQPSVNVVCNDSYRLLGSRLHVASHVLLEHGLDDFATALVVCEDCLTTQRASFLGCIPMEFDRVGCLSACNSGVGQQDSKGLQDRHGARSLLSVKPKPKRTAA